MNTPHLFISTFLHCFLLSTSKLILAISFPWTWREFQHPLTSLCCVLLLLLCASFWNFKMAFDILTITRGLLHLSLISENSPCHHFFTISFCTFFSFYILNSCWPDFEKFLSMPILYISFFSVSLPILSVLRLYPFCFSTNPMMFLLNSIVSFSYPVILFDFPL